jgi:L-histidine N-alpha-methyltransferase
MHLRSARAHTARLDAIELDVSFGEGETIRTEISRKWTRRSLQDLLARTGLEVEEWFTDPNRWFALSLVRRAD